MKDKGLKLSAFKGLPNYLTLFRIASIPVLLVFYPLSIHLKIGVVQIFCAGLFGVAAFTDLLDGYFARRFKLESKIGVILDPIADKTLVATGLVLLVSTGALWTTVAGLFIVREIIVTGARLASIQHGFEIPVSALGKFKTLFLDFAIGFLLVNDQPYLFNDEAFWGIPWRNIGMILMWIAFFLSMYSAWEYLNNFFKKIKL